MSVRVTSCLSNVSRRQVPSFPKITAYSHRHGTVHSYSSTAEALPRVAQPSLWYSVVPKFLRKSESSEVSVKRQKSKEWNPATFYIVIFLLIGSNAIQMIALRNDFTNFSRRADAKIGLLKEVIDRVQRGEDVDVEGLLGTGDVEKEKEWEDVLREIQEEDELWQSETKKRRRATSAKNNDKGPASETAKNVENKPNNKDTEDNAADTESQEKPLVRFY